MPRKNNKKIQKVYQAFKSNNKKPMKKDKDFLIFALIASIALILAVLF